MKILGGADNSPKDKHTAMLIMPLPPVFSSFPRQTSPAPDAPPLDLNKTMQIMQYGARFLYWWFGTTDPVLSRRAYKLYRTTSLSRKPYRMLKVGATDSSASVSGVENLRQENM